MKTTSAYNFMNIMKLYLADNSIGLNKHLDEDQHNFSVHDNTFPVVELLLIASI